MFKDSMAIKKQTEAERGAYNVPKVHKIYNNKDLSHLAISPRGDISSNDISQMQTGGRGRKLNETQN